MKTLKVHDDGTSSLVDTQKDRAIIKFLNTKPWAITREALETIQAVVANHVEGLPVTINADNSKAKTLGHIKYPDVAVVPIHGTVAKRLYGMEAISGGTTTKDWEAQIQAALDDPNISAIVLDIDSPGGTVDGTKELADMIYAGREQKPIVAYANGQMASAAYWIGSAASKVVAFDTAMVGSIGVIISHKDFSEREKQMGVKTTHIYAGKYKAMASPFKPLEEEGKKYLQASVDYYYTMFVDAVARQRGVDVETVLAKMANGQVFIGTQSKEAGLVDLIGNLEDAILLAKQEGGNKVDIKEAVEKFGAKDLLAHLISTHSAELPEQVVSAYEEASKPVMEIPAEFKAMFDELSKKVETLSTEKQEAEDKLRQEREEAEQKEQRAKVIERLTAVGLQEDETFIALGMEVDEEKFEGVVNHVSKLNSRIKEVSGELFEETPNTTSKSKNEMDDPTDFDAACNMVSKRDNIDIEEAITVAAKEFPELYRKNTEGGK